MTDSRFKRPHPQSPLAHPATRRLASPGANGGHPFGVPSGENVPHRVLRMLQAANAIEQSGSIVDQMPSALSALPRPTRIFRPAGITPAAAMAANSTAAAVQVRWPQSCYVVGITFGTIESTAAALGALSVRIQVDGSLDLFTDGQAGAFAHAASLAGSDGIAQAAFLPFIRYANQSTSWQVTCKNEAPGGGATLTPVVQFLIVDPRDLVEDPL